MGSTSDQWQIQYPIIDELADEFSALVSDIRRVVRALGRDELKELKERVEDKLKSKKMQVTLPDSADDIINTIHVFWDHLNFEFTRSVVRYLNNKNLMKKMKSYEQIVKKMVGKCLKECKTRAIRPKPPPECVCMTVQLEVDPFSYSLHQVLNAKHFLVDKLGLSKAIFAGFKFGSIVHFFYIPKDTVRRAAARLPACQEDLHELKIVKVEVEGYFSFDVVSGKVSLHDCLC